MLAIVEPCTLGIDWCAERAGLYPGCAASILEDIPLRLTGHRNQLPRVAIWLSDPVQDGLVTRCDRRTSVTYSCIYAWNGA